MYDRKALIGHVLVANSPFYIVDKFQNEPRVAAIARRSTNSILRSLSSIDKKAQRYSRADAAYAYALAIAIYLKGNAKALERILPMLAFDPWFERIVSFLLAKLKSRASIGLHHATGPMTAKRLIKENFASQVNEVKLTSA